MLKKTIPQIELNNVLIIQTAFLGDVVLTLPLAQEIKRRYPGSGIDMVVIPRCAEVLANHPDIRRVIVFDKRQRDKGISGLYRVAKLLKGYSYDLILVPHRSLRSALLARLAAIPQRIGFNTSAGTWLFTNQVPYIKSHHEIERNLELIKPLGIQITGKVLPNLYPSLQDCHVVDGFIHENALNEKKFITIAPGTVWNTKRWMPEGFVELSKKLIETGHQIVLVGGAEDKPLCSEIKRMAGSNDVHSSAGLLTILQSAELLRRCAVIVSNDSAPMHLAVAMRTPVVAIFGATVPEFGFAPAGVNDVVAQTTGLKCRPCSIHGGNVCPIKTFDCMKMISAETVFRLVMQQINTST